MASLLKLDKEEVKKVVGSILGGEEEKELDLLKSHEKFKGMYKQARRYCILFELTSTHDCLQAHAKEIELIKSYTELIRTEIENSFEKYDINKLQPCLDVYPILSKELKEEASSFLKYFNAMKQSSLVHTIITTGNNMIDYKTYLEDPDKIDDSFIIRSSMLTWEPVQDLPVNFKLLYTSVNEDDRSKKFFLSLFHKLYDITTTMYKERGKVDIDTSAFVRAVHTTVDRLKKEIPRCEDAFKKILDSTSILETNYEEYYKDYVGCNNSMVIAENFIQDVAQTIEKSPKLAFQFRKIIGHLRKLTNRLTATDPKYKQTFDTLLSHADKSYKEVEDALQAEGTAVEEDDNDEEPESTENVKEK